MRRQALLNRKTLLMESPVKWALDAEDKRDQAEESMSLEENRALVRRFYADVVSGGDLSVLETLIAPDYCDHNAGPQSRRGPAVVQAHVAALRTTFPDFTLDIEDMVAEGDRVVTRVSGRGTHLGRWMGITPTSRVVHVRGINIDRIAGGQIAEHWGEADTVGMLVQMGLDPFAGQLREEWPL